jgi:AmmeMemoRadiSam system protein B
MSKKAILILLIAGLLAAFFIFEYKRKEVLPQNNSGVFHYSYFSQPDFFNKAYASAKPATQKPNIKGIIVNHHLLAANFIAETFNAAAIDAPLTVLLISPNHFDVGRGQIITTSFAWKTPYGNLEPDLGLIQKLEKESIASVESPPFEHEHGVSGIVAFIKKSLPNAKVVPVIFKSGMPVSEAQKLAGRYSGVLPNNTLVVGSFDFSHYLTSRASDFHDINSLAALQNFDFSKINNLDADSRPGLAFFLELMKGHGAQSFHILENSNSSKLAGQDILETTSYITGYFTLGQPKPALAHTLLSLPSLYISPEVLPQTDRYSPAYALTYTERLFYGQDKAVAFVNNSSAGINSTLSRFGITPVLESSYNYELGIKKIRIIDCTKEPSSAHKYIDEEADAVVCQDAKKNAIQFYKNKPIIYTAGNLLGKKAIYKGETSLAVGFAYLNNQLQIHLLPLGGDGKQIKLLIGKESGTVLKEMAGASEAPEEIKEQIQTGVIILKD